jgi:hypothetical protein
MPGVETAGRFCPPHYFYGPEELAKTNEKYTDEIIVAGGIYGNVEALNALKSFNLPSKNVVLGGDFNWFNISPDLFEEVNLKAMEFTTILGNVETELVSPTDNVGCGCAYPESVPEIEVSNSNEIMTALQSTSKKFTKILEKLKQRPKYARFKIGSLRVLIVHGDTKSLSGWSFSRESLNHGREDAYYADLLTRSNADVIACSHTCLPASKLVKHSENTKLIINNGAAGMPNFKGELFGLATRFGAKPSNQYKTIWSTQIDDVFIDLIKIEYDQSRFMDQFTRTWAPGSAAHTSYFGRLTSGTQIPLDHL